MRKRNKIKVVCDEVVLNKKDEDVKVLSNFLIGWNKREMKINQVDTDRHFIERFGNMKMKNYGLFGILPRSITFRIVFFIAVISYIMSFFVKS